MKKNMLWFIVIFAAGLIGGYFWGSRQSLPTAFLSGNRQTVTPNQAAVLQPAIHNLSGLAAEIKSNGVVMAIPSTLGGRIASQEKMAKVDGRTAIYLLSKKTDQELWGNDYQQLTEKQNALKQAGQNRDAAAARRLVGELRQLYQQATEAKAAQTAELQVKLDALTPEQTAEKQELTRQIAELNSAFNYRLIDLKEIKVGDNVAVWSEADLAVMDSFLAQKIEVSR